MFSRQLMVFVALLSSISLSMVDAAQTQEISSRGVGGGRSRGLVRPGRSRGLSRPVGNWESGPHGHRDYSWGQQSLPMHPTYGEYPMENYDGYPPALDVYNPNPFGCGTDCGTGCQPDILCGFPWIFVAVENLWLHRDTGENENFALGVANGQPFSIGTDDLDFGYEPGYRITMGIALSCTTYLEASYFGLHEWEASKHISAGALTVITQGTTRLLSGGSISQQDVNYDISNLHNAELNMRTYIYVYPYVSLLVGIRFIKLDEEYIVRETGLAADLPGNLPATAMLRQTTVNNMIGVHFGGDSIFQLGRSCRIGLYGRLGVFSNFSEVKTTVGVTDIAGGAFSASKFLHGQQYMIGLGAGLASSFQIKPNILIHGGYRLLYLDDMVIAPEQTILDSILDDDGNVFLHGPYAGVELRWGSCD